MAFASRRSFNYRLCYEITDDFRLSFVMEFPVKRGPGMVSERRAAFGLQLPLSYDASYHGQWHPVLLGTQRRQRVDGGGASCRNVAALCTVVRQSENRGARDPS
jgi:hypothetical protein